MDHYLSDIASRSTGENFPVIMPVKPGVYFHDAGLANDVMGENDSQDYSRKDQKIRQNSTPVQPRELRELQHADNKGMSNNRMSDRHPGKSYFTRYVERVETVKEKDVAKNLPQQKVHPEKGEPFQNEPDGIPRVKDDIGETTEVSKTGSIIFPAKKGADEQNDETSGIRPMEKVHDDETDAIKEQSLLLSAEDERQDTINIPDEISPERHIFPNRPVIENKTPVQNKIHKEAPKLVIGKITVEIIPPVVPLPQKTITKVIHASSDNISLKANKLSFGLGQL